MKKIIEGIVSNPKIGVWVFETEESSLSANVCFAIDEILDYETKEEEKFRITIEKI